jgi:hypothetical protein
MIIIRHVDDLKPADKIHPSALSTFLSQRWLITNTTPVSEYITPEIKLASGMFTFINVSTKQMEIIGIKQRCV